MIDPKFYIRTLTPIHIGSSSEKQKIADLDFIIKNKNIHFLDKNKVIEAIGIETYCNALINKSLTKIIDRRNLIEQVTEKVVAISGSTTNDLHSNLIDPLSGHVCLPGSSLKGAIRSVIISQIVLSKKEILDEKTNRAETISVLPMSNINLDPMRYLSVADTQFKQHQYYNSKVFSISREWKGAWKNDRKGSVQEFSKNGFTTVYQSISPDQISALKLQFNIIEYKKAKKDESVEAHDIFDNMDSDFTHFFDYIKEHSDQYLKAEIDFFSKYNNDKTDLIISKLEYLREQNKLAPILRVGAGSGFHGITGNIHHPIDHSIDNLGDRNRGLHNGKKSAKTRRLIFVQSEGKLNLWPMGFVQLLHYQRHETIISEIKEEQHKKAQELKQMKEAQLLEQKRKEKVEERRRQQALKPKMISITQLKSNKAIWIDAEVVGQKGNNTIFRPYIEELKNKEFQIRKPSGFPIHSIIQVKVKTISKGKNIQPQDTPRLK